MTEPGDDWNARSGPLASELLGAGRRERASEGARDRATQVLLASITASSAAAANAGAWTAALKWLGISVVLLGVGGGLWRIAMREPDEIERPAHVSHPPARATQHEVLDSNARDADRSASTNSAAPLTSAPAPRGSTPSAPPSPPASRTAAALRGAANPRLAQELLALNRARAAVAGGAPEQALSTLDAVAGGFQVLPLEANLVRVEALRGAGKRDSARALSERLLRAHPDGPYTERLRSLAAALGSSAPEPLPNSKSRAPGDAR
jgi:hypothetical protein